MEALKRFVLQNNDEDFDGGLNPFFKFDVFVFRWKQHLCLEETGFILGYLRVDLFYLFTVNTFFIQDDKLMNKELINFPLKNKDNTT